MQIQLFLNAKRSSLAELAPLPKMNTNRSFYFFGELCQACDGSPELSKWTLDTPKYHEPFKACEILIFIG